MKFEKLKQNRIFKILGNSFVIILLIFVVWIYFFDENTHLNREFNKEIKELQETIDSYKSKIERDKRTIKMLQDSLQLERFTREKYLMKKPNEDVYIIEFDSVKK